MFRIVACLIGMSLFLLLISCGENYTPKPRGYFRIALPEKAYITFDSTCPYTFEYPVYAKIIPDHEPTAEPFWINIDYPLFRGKLHISYKPVKNDLPKYLEDARSFVNKHIPKANEIEEKLFINKQEKVYGLMYDIKGIGAASSCQFYVTDSVTHFVRAALYFNVAPNNDSLAPVIDFLKEDVIHMINTFKWKGIHQN